MCECPHPSIPTTARLHIAAGHEHEYYNDFFKRRPMAQIYGSNLRVKIINGLTGEGDPVRVIPVSPGSIGRTRWRVGSGQEF